jgi:hypothetical protein
MTPEEKQAVWREAVDWERSNHIASLFEDSDKNEVLMALFRKARIMAEKETDPAKKVELKAYSEGFRHAINIMESRGPAMEAYKCIINPSIKVDLTEDEVRTLSQTGH